MPPNKFYSQSQICFTLSQYELIHMILKEFYTILFDIISYYIYIFSCVNISI